MRWSGISAKVISILIKHKESLCRFSAFRDGINQGFLKKCFSLSPNGVSNYEKGNIRPF